jgi:HlyD family secretion protein
MKPGIKRLLFIIPLLWLVACQQDEEKLQGYIEGEFVMVAPSSDGVLKTLDVERGQQVAAGAKLFSIDLTMLTAQRDAAKAEIAKAEAELADLKKGERAEEIEIVVKQREQAVATLEQAAAEYTRSIPLVKTGAVSKTEIDKLKMAQDTATARIQELDAQLKTSELGARIDRIDAAAATVEMAKQKLAEQERWLAEAAPVATAAAKVEDTFYRPGEFVAAGKPVVSLLQPEHVKARFFVPQSGIAQLKEGQAVSLSCDGCGAPIAAKITFIAAEAEFTPPVIYSVESRQKLVFMVEAKPDAFDSRLKLGLPVDVEVVK